MSNFLITLKESFVYEIIWIFLGVVLGKLTEILVRLINEQTRKNKMRKKLKNADYFSLDNHHIISLDHADPVYDLHDIVVEQTDKRLFVECPEEYRGIIQNLDPDFTFSSNMSFNRSKSFEDLGIITQIENLPELIKKHSVSVAKYVIAKLEDNHTIFNGRKYGVYRILRKRNADQDENASLKIDLFETDYFTHLIFRSIYKELKLQGHPISKIEKMEEIHKYTPFTTSFGMNTYLLLDTPSREEIIFAKRSKYLNKGSLESQWHVTMNEGLTLTDKEGKEISLIKCLHRGLREELGIREEHHKHVFDERFMDLFIEMTKFEIGLTSYVKMELSLERLLELYSISKDGELETDGLKSVPINSKELKEFLNTAVLTPAAKYTLSMYLARKKSL